MINSLGLQINCTKLLKKFIFNLKLLKQFLTILRLFDNEIKRIIIRIKY